MENLEISYGMITSISGAVFLKDGNKNLVDLVFHSNISEAEKLSIVIAAGEAFVKVLQDREKAKGLNPEITRLNYPVNPKS